MKYDYPGNIRELENIIERAVVLARGNVLTQQDLPVFIDHPEENDLDIIPDHNSLPLPERLNIIEKNLITQILRKHNFNQSKAAEELGISESGIRYKIQSLKIKR